MADRKHPKLSLKRKSTLNFPTLAKKDNREEKSDNQSKASRNEIAGSRETRSCIDEDVVIIDEEIPPGKRFKSSTGEEIQTVISTNNTRPTKFHFLNVEDDLRKLRLMFVKLKNPALNLKLLSDLPPFEKIKEKSCNSTSRKAVTEDLDSLSALPSMCLWCRKRKPSDYSHLYDKTTKETLQVKESDTLSGTEVSKTQKTESGDSLSVKKEENYQRELPHSVNYGLKCKPSISSTLSKRRNVNESVMKDHVLDTDRDKFDCDVKPGETKKTAAGEPSENVRIFSDRKDFERSVSVNYEKTLSHQQKTQNILSSQNRMNIIKQKVVQKNDGKTVSNKITRGRPDIKIDYQPVDRTKKLFKTSKHSIDESLENTTTSQFISPQAVKGGNSKKMTAEKQTAAPGTIETESVLQSCPLCQHVFKAGDLQIDKDGHIAACLSNSADDVIW